jgi:protein ImuB
MQRALCIWLPNWPIQRRTLARPALKRRALVVYEQHRRGCFRVTACSESAAERGVEPGMPLAEATSLASAELAEDDPRADREALEELAGWCETFSPIVGLEDARQAKNPAEVRPESLLLDVTGLAPLFDGEPALVERISRAFAQRGLYARTALADTVGAAWALAHFGVQSSRHAPCAVADRELAPDSEIAIELEIGYGTRSVPTTLIAPPGQTQQAIEPLPVTALRLPSSTSDVLVKLGIRSIGQLLALPRESLAARFEPELIERLDQALGAAPEPIVAHRPAPDIAAERLLEYPIGRREAVEQVLEPLIEQVAAALAAGGQGALQLQCELSCETGERLPLVLALFEASAAPRHWFELAKLQLEQVRLPGPISAVRLSVLSAAPLVARQQELFADERPHLTELGRRQLALLIDRLSSRLRREAVSRAVLTPDAQPEYAYRYEPLAGLGPRRKPASKTVSKPAGPWPRPLWLHSTPTPLETLAVAPRGPLVQFLLHGRTHQVARRWGPERIQTGWWRGRDVRRDYYRIETSAGRRFWVFRQPSDGQWFLHGSFD